MKRFSFLAHHLGRPWYPSLIAVLAGADLFLFAVPTDALLFSAVAANRSRWWLTALLVAAGSTSGAVLFAYLFLTHQAWVLGWLPLLSAGGSTLPEAFSWVQRYSEGTLLFGAVGPLPLHPFLVGAALSGSSLAKLGVLVFCGRAAKYLAFAGIAALAPQLRTYLTASLSATFPKRRLGGLKALPARAE